MGYIKGIIKPYYYKGERGNKPYPLELMLRIFVLQNLYDLADMRVMTEVIDSRAFSEFCGVTSPDEVPDGDTIGRFRTLLEKKGNQWYFGYKGHIGVDEKSGLVHHVKVTPANTADVTAVPELLYGEEDRVGGDSGYLGADKRDDAVKKNKAGKKEQVQYQPQTVIPEKALPQRAIL